MSALIAIGLFLLGTYLSMRSITALYRMIDLWYTIRTAWGEVARGILGWGGVTAALSLLLQDHQRSAFLWGLGAYLAFYLATYFIVWHLVIPRLMARNLASARCSHSSFSHVTRPSP